MSETDSAVETRATNSKPTRGTFGQITGFDDGTDVRAVLEAFADALPEPMAKFDDAERGDAINRDLYDYDSRRDLAVVQVRHAFRRYRHGFLNVHKTYHLVGFSERGEPFRHPISGPTAHAAIRRDGYHLGEVVKAAERWIFDVTPRQYARGVRQGDLLMFRARGQPAPDAVYLGRRLVILESHELRAAAIWRDDREIWAFEPSAYHREDDHAPVYAHEPDRWYVVRPGRESATHAFARRIRG